MEDHNETMWGARPTINIFPSLKLGKEFQRWELGEGKQKRMEEKEEFDHWPFGKLNDSH